MAISGSQTWVYSQFDIRKPFLGSLAYTQHINGRQGAAPICSSFIDLIETVVVGSSAPPM